MLKLEGRRISHRGPSSASCHRDFEERPWPLSSLGVDLYSAKVSKLVFGAFFPVPELCTISVHPVTKPRPSLQTSRPILPWLRGVSPNGPK